ncbi:hypothetical protein KJ951_02035 [Patescibacteria group bacterium]|nr:hypothetical protein [Patescibacteria group bacterium]MBU1703159.1 hypothetical protein [Patescibacteria group bacterium]
MTRRPAHHAAPRAYAQGLLHAPPPAALPARLPARTLSERLPREPLDFNSDPADLGGVVEEIVSPAISAAVLMIAALVLAVIARGIFF